MKKIIFVQIGDFSSSVFLNFIKFIIEYGKEIHYM